MPSAVDQLLAHWEAHDARIRPGVPMDRIEAFEVEHGVQLPDDLRVYFSRCDGIEGGTSATGHVRELMDFWPLAQLERLGPPSLLLPGDLGAADAYFAFADYSIHAAVFAIRLTADARAKNPVILEDLVCLADSFTDFIHVYLERPEELLGPPRRRPGDPGGTRHRTRSMPLASALITLTRTIVTRLRRSRS
jgi:hypothetical protein